MSVDGLGEKMMGTQEEEMILAVADSPALYPVIDGSGATIGHVELPPMGTTVSHEHLEHLKHELMQVRNQVVRLQTQVKLLELRAGRR